jgi:hypothetical protein
MRVRDLQQFLESFTARDKSSSGQGNAISDAVIYVEVNGQLRGKGPRSFTQENFFSFLVPWFKNHGACRLWLDA